MFAVKTKIIGLKELGMFSKELPLEVKKEVDRNVIPLCKPIEIEASRLAPYKTGKLSRSITTEHPAYLTGMVRDGVHYGIWQEIGFYHWITGEHIKRPFLVPALNIKIPEVLQNLKEIIHIKLERMKRKK